MTLTVALTTGQHYRAACDPSGMDRARPHLGQWSIGMKDDIVHLEIVTICLITMMLFVIYINDSGDLKSGKQCSEVVKKANRILGLSLIHI